MANSNEIAQLEQIHKGFEIVNTDINKATENYLKLVKTIADGNQVLKDNAISFDGLAKKQKETEETAKQLDIIDKQLVTSEKKLKEIEDTRYQQIVKNRVAIQQKTQALKDNVKSEGLAETSLIKMRQRLKELTTEYDKSGTRTKAAAAEINKLSREIGKAEAATNRHQRGVGGYADQLGLLGNKVSALPGMIGGVGNSISGLASKLGSLGGIGGIIAGTILLASAPLVAFFTKSEQGVELLERKVSGFKAAWGVLVGEMISGGEKIGNIFDKPEKKISSFWTNTLSLLGPGFRTIGIRMDIASSAAEDYTRTLQQLEDQERALIVPRAEANLKIKEAMLLYNDETKSLEVRMQGLKDAIDLENKTADIEIEHQKGVVTNLNIVNQQKLIAGQLRDEDDKKLQEAIAKQIELETESVGRQLRASKRLATGKKEILTEQENFEKEKGKAILDRLKDQEDAIKAANEAKKDDEFDYLKEYEAELDKDVDLYLKSEEDKTNKLNEELEKRKEAEEKAAEEKRILAEKQADEIANISAQLGESIGAFASGQIESFKEFSKELLLIALNALEKQIMITQVEILAKDLFRTGLAGAATAAIKVGLISAAFAGVKVAIQSFGEGTDNAPNKFIAGENGRELMFLRDGSLMMVDKPTYFEGNIFKGAQIKSNPETEKIISETEHSGFSTRTMTDERILKGLAGVERAIRNKPVGIYDNTNRVIGYQSGKHKEIYWNRVTRQN